MIRITQENIERGSEAFEVFHNFCVMNFSETYGHTWVSLKTYVDNLNPYFRNNLGDAIYKSGVEWKVVQESMVRLASASGGRLPTNPASLIDFTSAISDSLLDWTLSEWVTATTEAVKETAKELGSIALSSTMAIFMVVGVFLVWRVTR